MKKTAEENHEVEVVDKTFNLIHSTTPDDLIQMHAIITYHLLMCSTTSEKEADKRYAEIGKIMCK